MIKKFDRREAVARRHKRVRKNVFGTSKRPRLCVSLSNKNIFLQIIDDEKQVTLVSASTLQKDLNNLTSNVESGKKMGEIIAKKSIEAGIKEIVFDRGGHIYHGVVKAIAESARENGLEF